MNEYDRGRKQKAQMIWIESMLATVQVKRWYGSLILKVEDGMIRRVVKEESIMPPSDRVGKGNLARSGRSRV